MSSSARTYYFPERRFLRTERRWCALIQAHGYAELTPALKRKVFGLNGARVYGIEVPERRRKTQTDPIGTRKAAYGAAADPT